jgi:hypothetical protein
MASWVPTTLITLCTPRPPVSSLDLLDTGVAAFLDNVGGADLPRESLPVGVAAERDDPLGAELLGSEKPPLGLVATLDHPGRSSLTPFSPPRPVVLPTRLPLVRRRCHARASERFRTSNKFRVNANHKLIDAWLLALCTACGGNCKAHRPGADECALSPVAHLQITGSAASGALMRAGDGRVDANIPGDLADRVRLRLRPGQDPLPTRASCHRRTGQPGSMGLPYSALGFAHRLPYEVSGAVCDRQGGTGG